MFFSSVLQEGVLIQGLFLEGAGWDKRNLCLVEAEPMQMVSAMPAIHFRPVERKKTTKSESSSSVSPPPLVSYRL